MDKDNRKWSHFKITESEKNIRVNLTTTLCDYKYILHVLDKDRRNRIQSRNRNRNDNVVKKTIRKDVFIPTLTVIYRSDEKTTETPQ